jgi:hypothetical protein
MSEDRVKCEHCLALCPYCPRYVDRSAIEWPKPEPARPLTRAEKPRVPLGTRPPER